MHFIIFCKIGLLEEIKTEQIDGCQFCFFNVRLLFLLFLKRCTIELSNGSTILEFSVPHKCHLLLCHLEAERLMIKIFLIQQASGTISTIIKFNWPTKLYSLRQVLHRLTGTVFWSTHTVKTMYNQPFGSKQHSGWFVCTSRHTSSYYSPKQNSKYIIYLRTSCHCNIWSSICPPLAGCLCLYCLLSSCHPNLISSTKYQSFIAILLL